MANSPQGTLPRSRVRSFRSFREAERNTAQPPRQQSHTRRSPLFHSSSDLSSEPPDLIVEPMPNPQTERDRVELEILEAKLMKQRAQMNTSEGAEADSTPQSPRLRSHTRRSPLFHSSSDLSSEPPELIIEPATNPQRDQDRAELLILEATLSEHIARMDTLQGLNVPGANEASRELYANVTECCKKCSPLRSDQLPEEEVRRKRRKHKRKREKKDNVIRIYRLCNCKDHRCPDPYPPRQ